MLDGGIQGGSRHGNHRSARNDVDRIDPGSVVNGFPALGVGFVAFAFDLGVFGTRELNPNWIGIEPGFRMGRGGRGVVS